MMEGGNIAHFFDAAGWVSEWEANGGALHVRFHPDTRCVLAVRWIMPIPRVCWVRGLSAVFVAIPGPRISIERLESFDDLSHRLRPVEAYRALVRHMQARVDSGQRVQEYLQCVNDI